MTLGGNVFLRLEQDEGTVFWAIAPIYAPGVSLPLNETEVHYLFKRLFTNLTEETFQELLLLYDNESQANPLPQGTDFYMNWNKYDRIWSNFLTDYVFDCGNRRLQRAAALHVSGTTMMARGTTNPA